MSTKSVGFQTTRGSNKEPKKSEFGDWDQIKRCSVDSIYRKLLHFRSSIYPASSLRSRTNTHASIHRRRKRTESSNLFTESEGRSSVMSNNTDLLDADNFFKEDYDYDAEEQPEPPMYPHLVHTPGTYSQELYLKACKHFQIPHSSYFYKHLNGEVMVVKRLRLGPIGVKACAIALVETLTIHTLDLTDNNIGSEGAKYVAELIAENHFIKHLILTENNLGPEGVRELALVIQRTDSLQTLGIAGNGLHGGKAKSVCSIIEETHKLKKLDLSNNNLGDVGAELIGESLFWSDTIEKLDLSWNQIRGAGVAKIADAITKSAVLTHLDLSWNGLHLTGCVALAKALEKNIPLSELNITNNRVNRACLEKLLHGLKKNTILKTLRLGKNPLQPDDLILIVTFLKQYPSSCLETVGLQELDVNEQFVTELEDVKQSRPVNVQHGKVRGANLGIHDLDEGELLKLEADMVIQELSNILGINVENFFLKLEEDMGQPLDAHGTVVALKLINNPLSDRCTSILIKRLTRDGHVDMRQLSTKRIERKRVRELERKVKVPLHLQNEHILTESEKADIADFESVRSALYRVLARRLSGSSLYRQHMTAMRQTLTRIDVKGEDLIREHVMEIIKDYGQ